MTAPRYLTYALGDLSLLGRHDASNLKEAARAACRFWNHFCEPTHNVVLRVGCFREEGSRTIAKTWQPIFLPLTTVGQVEFNSKYLVQFGPSEASSILAHELGHALGFGLGNWFTIFDTETMAVRPAFLAAQNAYFKAELKDMRIGEGGHWDKKLYGHELMTGLANDGGEYVLEITIRLLELFGHEGKNPPNWSYQRKRFHDILREIPAEEDNLLFDPAMKLRALLLKGGLEDVTPNQAFELVKSRYLSEDGRLKLNRAVY